MNPIKVVKQLLRRGAMVTVNHTPELLMAVGTGAFVGTVVMAVKASPTIEGEFKEARSVAKFKYADKPRQIAYISAKMAPICAPTLLMGAASLACFFGAHKIQVKRQIALASAYSMASQTLNSYQEKVIEKFGDEEHKSIIDRILEDEEPLKDVGDDPDVYEGTGDVLVYDRVTGRYFKSTPEKIREAEGLVAKRMVDEMVVPLNYFYEELGLDDVSFIGEAIGWDVERCKLDIQFRSSLDECNRPCLVIIYSTQILDKNALRAL